MEKHEVVSKRRAGLTAAQQALLEKWKHGGAVKRPASAVITRRERPTRVPLSFAQMRLWFLDQLVPDNAAYNIPATVRLTGHLDVAALESALNEVTRRHETLRTVFASDGGEPLQVVLPHTNRELPIMDLRNLSAGEREAEVARLARKEAQRPFDLAHGPLLRDKLLRLSDDEHVFLLTMHHIISDGWSMNILVRELASAYEALSADRAPALPELPIQYADFALWQHEWLQREMMETHLSYWKRQLGGSPPVLELPTSRPRPAIQTFQGRYQNYELSASLTKALKSLAREEGVSLFVLMLAAFKTLLHRYTQQEDIIVGTPMANRSKVEVEGLIGFFANTLVLRTDLAGDPTFKATLARVREAVLSADAHQDVPFEQIVEELQPERDMSRNPLFQVMFIQDNTVSSITLPGLTFDALPVHGGTTKFDLSLSMTEREHALYGSVEYSTDIFDDDAIGRFVEHYSTLLASVAADRARRLSELAVLVPDERRRIVHKWNDTGTDFAVGARCLHHLIEQQAARTPDTVAVCFPADDRGRDDDAQLTYRELDTRANKLAHHLLDIGVGTESVVGIYVHNSLEMVVGLLGILKAGAAYVPLDPSYPSDRLAYMIEDSRIAVLLSQRHIAETLPEHDSRVVLLDADWVNIDRQRGDSPHVDLDPLNSAYVIYTSGSTGRPKGAVNTHSGICNRLLWMQSAYRLDAGDRVLQKTPFSFDVSVWEFFWPLLAGAQMVLAQPGGHKDSAYLARFIAEQKITVVHFVPSMLQVFLEENLEGCDSLRHVICSGEELPHSLQERFHTRLRAQLHNLYGPTEAAIDVTFWDCPRSGRPTSVPIGWPIANTRIHILDRYMNPTPVGVPGELHIGGVGLARGYLRRPDLTADRFVPDPFTSEAGGRLYKTADLARYQPNGSIDYLGRLDYQVKIRGCRIELGEIESTLRSNVAVHDAIVIERGGEQPKGHKQLVAYVIPDSMAGGAGAPLTENALSDVQFSQWRQVFDRTYEEGETPVEAALNLAGWNSSYTGQPLPAEEMREWAEHTSARILSLRPERALEIGCGTGLLLFRVAPHCAFYCGVDFSRAALDYVQRQLDRSSMTLPPVKLLTRMAHDIEGLECGPFDTVILNSVVQYFPSVNYLLRVLESITRLLDRGSIFVGDVRSLPLLEAFHTSVELHRAPDTLTIEELRQRARHRVKQENELVIDPEFFFQLGRNLPAITRVEVQLKRGHARNELTNFRYDVFIHVNGESGDWPTDATRLDWREQGLTLEGLRQILSDGSASPLYVTNVPDERLRTAVGILEFFDRNDRLETAGALREFLRHSNGRGSVDPEHVWALCEETGYEAVITPSRGGRVGSFDLLVTRRGATRVAGVPQLGSTSQIDSAAEVDWQAYANNPCREMLAQQLFAELRKLLKDRLPDYMMPASFMLMDAWPLTPNGKLDRKALPPPPQPMPEMEAGYMAPRTPVETVLADIWAQVLRLDRVGVRDNFFELGGDSIHSIQVVARATQAGLRLSPRHLFQYQTIAELADVAEVAVADNDAHAHEAVASDDYRLMLSQMPNAPAQIEDVYPLTPMQEHMLYQVVNNPRPGLYVVHHAFAMRGVEIDVRAFEEAWQRVIDRHAVLRTYFAWQNLDEPLQVVDPGARLYLEQEDWRHLSEAEQHARLAAFETEARSRGFDLAHAPHTRLALFRLSDDAYYFVYVFHLMLQDGWSYSPIMKEVFTHYKAIKSGHDLALDPPDPYRDYIEWARRQDLGEAEAYWRGTLDGVSLPAPRLTTRAFNKEDSAYLRESIELSPELTSALAALAKQRRLTLYTLVQGAWAILLSRYGGVKDVVFGSVVSGRSTELKGIEHRVGLYFNILPVRAAIEPDTSLLSYLSDLQTQNVDVSRYQYTPLKKIHEWLEMPREQPLFDNYLVFENFPVDPSLAHHASGLGVGAAHGMAQTEQALRFELMLGKGLILTMCYYGCYFGRETIDCMLSDVKTLLGGIVADPERPLSALLRSIEPPPFDP